MCRLFHRKKYASRTIPSVVSDAERLLRFVLSPLHFKKGKLRSNVFNPTKDSDAISVTRLDCSSVEECKRLAHKMDLIKDGTPIREYCGFGLLNKHIAIECGVKDVVSAPVEDNPAHAHILVNEVREGDAIPASMQLVIDNLLERTKFFLDKNPKSKGWEGDPLQL